MKKIVFAVITLLIFCGTFLFSQPVSVHGQLKVDGVKIKDEHGNTVVLRGMSFGWHNWWPKYYNANVVKWLSDDWQCTVIRAAMGVEPKGSYLSRTKWSLNLMYEVIDAAIANGIYVIIDWHCHNINAEAKDFFI
ncbi:MAG: glycoside hydrolase family 5 protein [Bacteroidales bacterium]|nr:glycoside hydrolase family 5 protein [Bacteroidales bacterium]